MPVLKWSISRCTLRMKLIRIKLISTLLPRDNTTGRFSAQLEGCLRCLEYKLNSISKIHLGVPFKEMIRQEAT